MRENRHFGNHCGFGDFGDGDDDDDDDGVADVGALCPWQGPRSSLHPTRVLGLSDLQVNSAPMRQFTVAEKFFLCS